MAEIPYHVHFTLGGIFFDEFKLNLYTNGKYETLKHEEMLFTWQSLEAEEALELCKAASEIFSRTAKGLPIKFICFVMYRTYTYRRY